MVRIFAENTCRNSTPLIVDLLMSLAKSEASVSLSPERTAAVTDLVNNGYCERNDKYLAFNSIAEESRDHSKRALWVPSSGRRPRRMHRDKGYARP